MNVNETVFLCTKGPLTANEVELLEQRTRNLYRINMVLDDLPVTWSSKGLRLIGVPLGYRDFSGIRIPVRHIDDFFYAYIINHLKFRVLIHEQKGSGFESDEKMTSKFEIVGFEVVPCSVKHNLTDMSKLHMHENIFQPINCAMERDKSQIIYENRTVVFTYEVEFVKSNITWPSQWDSYSEMEEAKARRSSIPYTVITFLIMEIIVLFHFRNMRRNLIKDMNGPVSGWKLVGGDVFRETGCAKLLCAMVGDGVQITATTFVTLALSVLGFVSLVSRGVLLTTFIMLYLFFSITAGYTSVRLWKTIKATSEGWKSVSWFAACFFPGIAFIVFMYSNILLSGTESTKTISVSLFLIHLSLWLFVSVPLTLIGGFMGTKATAIPYHVRTNEVPNTFPRRPKFLGGSQSIILVGCTFLLSDSFPMVSFQMSSLAYLGAFGSDGSIPPLLSCFSSSQCSYLSALQCRFSLPTRFYALKIGVGGGRLSSHLDQLGFMYSTNQSTTW